MKKQVNKTSKIQVIKLFVKYQLLLPINTFFCGNKYLVKILLKTKFKKEIKNLQKSNNKNRYLISDKELIKGIITAYFQQKKRLFIKDYITSMYMVPDATYKMVKSQGRNEPCNCGSGKKFKKCCQLKYR